MICDNDARIVIAALASRQYDAIPVVRALDLEFFRCDATDFN